MEPGFCSNKKKMGLVYAQTQIMPVILSFLIQNVKTRYQDAAVKQKLPIIRFICVHRCPYYQTDGAQRLINSALRTPNSELHLGSSTTLKLDRIDQVVIIGMVSGVSKY